VAVSRPPEWYLRSPLHMRWYAMRLGLSDKLRHAGEVPPDQHGRPGARCLFPARPVYGRVNVDETRTDFQVLLSPRGSVLLAVCVERASDPGVPWERSLSAIAHVTGMGATVAAPMTRTHLCGVDAVAHTIAWGTFSLQHEWKLIAHGWLYYVGVVQRRNDSGAVLDLALRALGSWRWLPPVDGAHPATGSTDSDHAPAGGAVEDDPTGG